MSVNATDETASIGALSGVMHVRALLVIAVFAAVACKRTAASECPESQPYCTVPPIPAVPAEKCDPRQPRVCVGNEVVECEPEGVVGRGIRLCEEGCKHGKCIASCESDAFELIYLVDDQRELLSFDPRKLPGDPFARIATLTCDPVAHPTSMAVDRHGFAWVRYSNGKVYRVSIEDGACESTSYVPDPARTSFGMGFVTDEAKGRTEKLFLSPRDGANTLAFMNPGADDLRHHRAVTIAATTGHNPELTGTAEAKLFGFFPVDDGGRSFVQEIDRASGAALGQRWALTTSPAGAPILGYAFAQWAGVFYVFLTYEGDDYLPNSTVHTIDRATGATRKILEHQPYTISGAGVSTCAPDGDAR